MEIDANFEAIDEDPVVPDKLIDRTLRHAAHLIRVDVERRRGTNAWKKINGFKCDQDRQGLCVDAPEEIASMVVKMAQYDHDEIGGTEHYRAKFHVPGKGGKVDRKTFAFRLTEDSEEPEAASDELERNEVLTIAFDRAIQLITVQNQHIDSLNGQILNQAQTQAGQTAPLLETINTLVSKYQEGLTMQANAVQAVAEIERSGREIEAKAERDKQLLDLLSVAAPKAFEQFGSYLERKRTGQEPPKRSETIQDETKPQAEAPKAEASPSAEGPEPEAPDQDEPEMEPPGEIENPITLCAHAFKDSIMSEQWMQLADVLSKQEMALLRKATTMEDDESTADAILAFKNSLRPSKYLRLNRILDEEQRKMILGLLDVIADKTPDDSANEDTDEKPQDQGDEDDEGDEGKSGKSD